MAYFVYSLVFVPSQVALYKDLYGEARAQVGHLLKEKATLVIEVDDLRGLLSDERVQVDHLLREKATLVNEVDDLTGRLSNARVQVDHLLREKATLVGEVDNLKGRLSNAKVDAFWEMARVMETNMDTWVGADDPGGEPKFWSYGITSGKYHHADPPVTATQISFSSSQATVVESTDSQRVVGYRVESSRSNNGWWMATGLTEFGQSGYHRLQFSAEGGPPNNGAAYEVIVFHAKWA